MYAIPENSKLIRNFAEAYKFAGSEEKEPNLEIYVLLWASWLLCNHNPVLLIKKAKLIMGSWETNKKMKKRSKKIRNSGPFNLRAIRTRQEQELRQ